MRLALMTMGSTGDVRPYVLLGKELRHRGHEVRVAAFPDFEGMIRSAGLDYFPLAGDAREFMASVMKPSAKGVGFLVQINRCFKDLAPILLRDLMRAGEGADAICCTFFGSVFYSVAEKYNIPCIQTHYFPMDRNDLTPIASAPGLHLGKGWYHFSYRLGYLLISLLERYLLTDWRQENEVSTRTLKTIPDYQVNGRAIPVIYAISEQVFPRDPGWDSHIQMSGYWWSDEAPDYTPPEELQAFLDGGSPPVYIGFGSMVSGDMRKTAATVLSAVHQAGIRAVFSAGWSEETMDLHSNHQVYFADYIPHDWLFPRVAAVVHHGGAGTTATGLRYGKPTLAIPFGGDQPFWGKRIYDLGCGPRPLLRNGLQPGTLAERLQELLQEPGYRLAAESLSAALSCEHGLQKAADMIEEEIGQWYSKT